VDVSCPVAQVEGQLSGGDIAGATGANRPFSDTCIAELKARKRSLYMRVNRAATAGCPTQAGYTTHHRPGAGGMPLVLALSKYEGTSAVL